VVVVKRGIVGAVQVCNSNEEPELELCPEVDPMLGVEDESTEVVLVCNDDSGEPVLGPRLKVELVLEGDEETIVGVPVGSNKIGELKLWLDVLGMKEKAVGGVPVCGDNIGELEL
jgi:hypothetical protein